ncbi:MAG: pantetheine-phosphate adenylyltransferase [Deltaproteobacteria bacterium]|nr:MAG: pantetheine-phosphate adenylyltransferase [Deltaproteobacteria bacterium]
MNNSLAIYPGTFDPITNGHLDIINRALNLFDRIIITIGTNPKKTPLFSLEERSRMIDECFTDSRRERISTAYVSGLLVDFAREQGAGAIIRGLRAVSDFDYEFQLALMNRKLAREVETIFLMPGFRWIYISSSIIKEAASNNGDVSELVPPHVNQYLIEKYQK